MTLTFLGKHTFESTDPTAGDLFAQSASSHGSTYPIVSGVRPERWIVYQADDGSVRIRMGDLSWLAAVESVGWVAGTDALAGSVPLRVRDVPENPDQVSFEVEVGTPAAWEPVRYHIDTALPLSYLVFAIPPSAPADTEAADLAKAVRAASAENPGPMLTAFRRAIATPSLAEIQRTRDARGLDLRHVDLTGADLSGVDCTGADFTEACLDQVDFSAATLTDAVLVGASLDGTHFDGATLDRARFSGTDIRTVVWGGGLSAKDTHFEGCLGTGADFGTKDGTPRNDLTGARLDGASFSQADFTNADLTSASMLAGVFVGATFEGTDLTSAQLGGLDKSAAADLSFAYLHSVRFTKANLFGVSFASASVYGASTVFSGVATMEQADFSNAYMEGVDLSGIHLSGVRFDNACLVQVVFNDAYLTPTLSGSIPTSLVGACLQGAVFTDARMDHADLTGATVAFASGTLPARYCDSALGGLFPPPPNTIPLPYPPTRDLDLSTLAPTTVCPNGDTVAANQRQGNDLRTMLTVSNPATHWYPVRCDPGTSLSAGEIRRLRVAR